MEIVTLPKGEGAPLESDCISIDRMEDGRFMLSGSLMEDDHSTSLLGTIHDTHEAAEAEGMAWADACGVARLYVATDAPSPA